MTQIKFSHWFWITTLSGLLFVHSNNAIKTEEESLDQVRVGHSIASYPGYEEAKKPWTDSSSSSISTSTSKTVSVSHVRYQVGQNQHHHQPSRNVKKIIKKKVQKRRTFLEKIYAKIKELARIYISDDKTENIFGKNTSVQNNSENNSHNIAASQSETREKPNELKEDKSEESDENDENIYEDNRKWNEAGHESPNVVSVSFNEFSDGPLIVDTHDVSENVVTHNQATTDIEMSNNVRMIAVDDSVDQGSQSQQSLVEESPRSLDARGRSLWPINIPRRAKVIESVNNDDGDSGKERKGLEARFQSFTQERAVMFDSESRSGDSSLVEWTNIIILGVTIATAFAFISVLVAALVYRRSKMKDSSNNCDQFSDIMSTSSRSTASTISSTRSCKSIPDKVDIISFNAEGNLRKSAYKCDDLYSLDSDYFLSSLEDISVQI